MTSTPQRNTPFHMTADEFRSVGRRLVDAIADHLATLPERPVTNASSPHEIRALLGDDSLPRSGTQLSAIIDRALPLLVQSSLHTTHPRFWGYITGSAAPAGMLTELLGAAINPNAGAWVLSPVATEIERQAIRWLADLIGYPRTCGGIMVSGGNAANFVGFLAARRAKAGWDIRARGVRNGPQELAVYVSGETHTWIHKAADLFGLGTDAIRWVATDNGLRMDMNDLRRQVNDDKRRGVRPIIVVGAAGTVGTGAIDPLPQIAALCREEDMWFHVDGAYGAPAAALAEAPEDLKGLREADSVALDPHKWLYAPLEAGCALVRDPRHMVEAFSSRPAYYRFDSPEGEERTNFFEYGLQNSRGFRALKVWTILRQGGRDGIERTLREDISLSRAMEESIRREPAMEVLTQNLSIVTFRYVPERFRGNPAGHLEELNTLNTRILDLLQAEGKIFISNAVVRGAFALRSCIVNFRSTLDDVQAVAQVVVDAGRRVESQMGAERGAAGTVVS